MFVGRRSVEPDLCNREMFGDLVLVRQNAPSQPLVCVEAAAFPVPAMPKTQKSAQEAEEDKRRASQLIDELLLSIYARDGSLSSCTSPTNSFVSQKSFQKCTEFDLQHKGAREVRNLLNYLKEDVRQTGGALVRRLKRRDALRRQRDAHCDVISEQLRKRASEGSPAMRFSIEPGPGDSGFAQWHSAMRMVAQLPGGIPPEFRRKLWLTLAERHLAARGVHWPRVERECFSEWSHPADAELGVQIVKDLHRTGCSLFCGEDGQENQALLKRVLLAYARWNKAVGYCQGFNMLAALILQVTDKCESEALKLMIFLIEGVLPESYFADSLRGLSVDMAVFRELLRTRLPRLSRHLDTLQTAAKDGTTSYEPPLTNVFTMQWFLTLFCNCLPQPSVLRVWDLILLEGNEVLLRTALAIWHTLAERILGVRSADEFYCIMGVLTREILEFGIVDGNSLIKAIVTIGPLEELPALREKYLYNINPWGGAVSTDVKSRQLKVYGRERLALDISALKKQYSKLKQRQRQAHIIFSAAVARQPPTSAPLAAMNHLLLGRSALVPPKRLGPPKGAVPPARQPQQSLSWKDAAPRASSSSSSSDTELCDDPDEGDVSPIPPDKDDNLKSDIDLMKLDNTDSVAPPSAIFDTSAKPEFDFGRLGMSDSEDEGFDFERFLENRVRCLKQPSLDEDSVTSSEDLSERRDTRRNSQRALEIIQENSLILHRILQCQTRLTPSPPVLDDGKERDRLTEAKDADEIEFLCELKLTSPEICFEHRGRLTPPQEDEDGDRRLKLRSSSPELSLPDDVKLKQTCGGEYIKSVIRLTPSPEGEKGAIVKLNQSGTDESEYYLLSPEKETPGVEYSRPIRLTSSPPLQDDTRARLTSFEYSKSLIRSPLSPGDEKSLKLTQQEQNETELSKSIELALPEPSIYSKPVVIPSPTLQDDTRAKLTSFVYAKSLIRSTPSPEGEKSLKLTQSEQKDETEYSQSITPPEKEASEYSQPMLIPSPAFEDDTRSKLTSFEYSKSLIRSTPSPKDEKSLKLTQSEQKEIEYSKIELTQPDKQPCDYSKPVLIPSPALQDDTRSKLTSFGYSRSLMRSAPSPEQEETEYKSIALTPPEKEPSRYFKPILTPSPTPQDDTRPKLTYEECSKTLIRLTPSPSEKETSQVAYFKPILTPSPPLQDGPIPKLTYGECSKSLIGLTPSPKEFEVEYFKPILTPSPSQDDTRPSKSLIRLTPSPSEKETSQVAYFQPILTPSPPLQDDTRPKYGECSKSLIRLTPSPPGDETSRSEYSKPIRPTPSRPLRDDGRSKLSGECSEMRLTPSPTRNETETPESEFRYEREMSGYTKSGMLTPSPSADYSGSISPKESNKVSVGVGNELDVMDGKSILSQRVPFYDEQRDWSQFSTYSRFSDDSSKRFEDADLGYSNSALKPEGDYTFKSEEDDSFKRFGLPEYEAKSSSDFKEAKVNPPSNKTPEERPSFASILNSEYSRNLEEKYENLILKSSRPRFLDVAATSASEKDVRKSPTDCSLSLRSPTSGRIYNPFPVSISSRQNKDVAVRLGLYKK